MQRRLWWKYPPYKAQRFGGDWRLARDLPARMKEVTAESVRAFADKHLRNLEGTRTCWPMG